jgi:hypothetical protein
MTHQCQPECDRVPGGDSKVADGGAVSSGRECFGEPSTNAYHDLHPQNTVLDVPFQLEQATFMRGGWDVPFYPPPIYTTCHPTDDDKSVPRQSAHEIPSASEVEVGRGLEGVVEKCIEIAGPAASQGHSPASPATPTHFVNTSQEPAELRAFLDDEFQAPDAPAVHDQPSEHEGALIPDLHLPLNEQASDLHLQEATFEGPLQLEEVPTNFESPRQELTELRALGLPVVLQLGSFT